MLPRTASVAVAERIAEHILSLGISATEQPQKLYESERIGPFMCPVCRGTGKVISGFYSMTAPIISEGTIVCDPCRSCNMQGIVWSPDA
jgi:hypothetical protein